MEKSVKEMPPQSLEGWPDLDEIVYSQMIDQVSTYLPIIMATLKDIIPESQMSNVSERLCFALSTGKYMQWCFNRQDGVRSYLAWKGSPDFETPSLLRMVELIQVLIAEQGAKQDDSPAS